MKKCEKSRRVGASYEYVSTKNHRSRSFYREIGVQSCYKGAVYEFYQLENAESLDSTSSALWRLNEPPLIVCKENVHNYDHTILTLFESIIPWKDGSESRLGLRDVLIFEGTEATRRQNAYIPCSDPCRRLPVELLLKIYLLLLEEEASRQARLQTIISHVSSEWRAFALNTPCLWSTIRVCGRRDVDMMTIWLERSRLAPVVLKCDFEGLYDCPLLSKGLKAIRDHIGHISDLEIVTEKEAVFEMVVGALNCPAPILRALKVRRRGEGEDGDWYVPDEVAQALFGGETPQALRSLDIAAPYSLWPIGLTKNVTKLDLSHTDKSCSYPRALDVLECTPHVSVLSIRVYHGMYEFDRIPPVILPALTRLAITGHIQLILNLFDRLRLPNLTHLTVNPYPWDLYWNMFTESPAAIPSQYPLLERLEFLGHSDEDGTATVYLHRLLRRCDNLKELHIDYTLEPLRAIIGHLHHTLTGWQEQLCPRLEHLSISVKNYLEQNILTEFFWGRFDQIEGSPVMPLQTLSFHTIYSPAYFRIRDAVKYRPFVRGSIFYDGELL